MFSFITLRFIIRILNDQNNSSLFIKRLTADQNAAQKNQDLNE